MLAMAAIFAVSSCKTKRLGIPAKQQIPAGETIKTGSSSNAGLLAEIRSKNVDFKTLSIKAKADIGLGSSSQGATLNIRLRKDEAIWISATALLNVEVARVLITPDSIKIINRLQNTYTTKPFSFIHQYAGNSVSFSSLQALLTGNALPGTLTDNTNFETAKGQLIASDTTNSLSCKYLFNLSNRVSQLELSDLSTGRKLQASYKDHQYNGTEGLPQTIILHSSVGTKEFLANLRYLSIARNEGADMPFSSPKMYTLKN